MYFDPREKTRSILKKNIPLYLAVFFVAGISMAVAFTVNKVSSGISSKVPEIKFDYVKHAQTDIEPMPKEKWHFQPGPISMDVMKTKGCVADGMLSGYGDNTESMTKLINRSECVYLHRALETWANPPDFEKAEAIMERVKKEPVIYGMFIAEALRKNVDYTDENGKDFDFSAMCRKGTDNRWGEHTCIPNFETREYRKYLQYITHQAMDIGIQSFLFGQIYLQDADLREKSEIPKIVADMRKYAKSKNMQIVIGAQTNSITDQNYLKNFDYIEGGVGIDGNGNIENGPCLSRKSSCWSLLWNDRYAAKAKNVFLHLDWSGLLYDDMSIFARMDHETRINTLQNLYKYFTSRDMGFLMPMLAVINKENGGCYGPMKRFYSPDNKYSCDDENQINAILKENI
jgi:hypothetical protein